MKPDAKDRPRRRRFTPGAPLTNLTLMPRDISMLRALLRFRFLRSDQLARLAGGSVQGVTRRLRELYDARYVDRPRSQIASLVFGNRPMVYGLGDAGAFWLRKSDPDSDVSANRWREKNASATNAFVEHTTDLAEFFIALQTGARQRPGSHIIHAEELFDAASMRRRPAWSVSFLWHDGTPVELALVPDGVIAVEIPQHGRQYFFIEIDRGAEPIRRSDPSQSSIEKKFRAYAALQRSGHLGMRKFRTLFLTTSEARVQSMIELIPDKMMKRQFLFASLDSVSLDPLGAIWRNGRGEGVLLLEAAARKAL